jgi:Ca2+-binding RTX toxin-like protein
MWEILNKVEDGGFYYAPSQNDSWSINIQQWQNNTRFFGSDKDDVFLISGQNVSIQSNKGSDKFYFYDFNNDTDQYKALRTDFSSGRAWENGWSFATNASTIIRDFSADDVLIFDSNCLVSAYYMPSSNSTLVTYALETITDQSSWSYVVLDNFKPFSYDFIKGANYVKSGIYQTFYDPMRNVTYDEKSWAKLNSMSANSMNYEIYESASDIDLNHFVLSGKIKSSDYQENVFNSGWSKLIGKRLLSTNGDDYIAGSNSDDYIDGRTGKDTMVGGLGDDIYSVDNINDVVIEIANEGTDLVLASINYTLGEDVESLTLIGTNAINGTGNKMNNVITGNSRSNMIDGGAGNDTMIGGLGSDRFIFSSILKPNNVDTISDFSVAQGDTFALEDSVFAKLVGKTDLENHFRIVSSAAVGGDDYLVYNKATGQLFYDASGNGTGAMQEFFVLANKPEDLTWSQFIVI